MTKLNRRQQDAVDHIDGPLLILAGAGTGKTRVIVEKVGRLLETVPDLEPENVLALTFSNKAAGEMRERAIERFGDRARKCRFATFHSFCYRLLAKEEKTMAMDKVDHWIFLRRNLDRLELDRYLHVSDPGRFLDDLLEFYSRCHDNLVTPEEFSAFAERFEPEAIEPGAKKKKKPKYSADEERSRLREVAGVFARSERLQEEAGLIGFGAMLSRAAFLLERNAELLERQQNLYRYILVDEFQDTNWAQIRLLQLLAQKSRNIAAVGDPNQAIYHFRGASYASFELFERSFPGCKRVELTENYRSTKRILAVAAAAIASGPAPADRPNVRPLTTPNAEGPRVEVAEYASNDEQAEDVARDIARRVSEDFALRYSDFAALYRSHGHRNGLVAALRRHGIPFSIRKLAINSLPPVKDTIAALRAIGDEYDSVSLLRYLLLPRWKIPVAELAAVCREGRAKRVGLAEALKNRTLAAAESPDRALSRETAAALELLRRYREVASQRPLVSWLDGLRDELEFFAEPEDEPAWKALTEFVARWNKRKSATHRLAEFLEYFGLFEEAKGTINLEDDGEDIFDESGQPDPGFDMQVAGVDSPAQGALWNEDEPEDPRGKVQLMTIHSAKGLEFDHVYLLQLTNRQFPTRKQSPLISFPNQLVKGPEPRGDVHKEEERRLFYVALTRARKTLTLCTVSNQKQKPSEFLEQLRNGMSEALEWKARGLWGVSAASEPGLPEFMSRPGAPTAPAREELILSDSSIEAYLECPLKYYFANVMQVPIAPSPALRFGSIMHTALKKAVEILAHSPERLDAARIEEILKSEWQPAAFVEPAQERKYWSMGLAQLERLRQDALARPFQLQHQEKAFVFPAEGARLIGRIDQINRIDGKKVEILEYKTGRPKTQKEADESLQLTIYARACREVLDLEPVELALFNLETGERIATKRGPSDFRDLNETVQNTAAGIALGNIMTNSGYHCRFCDFRTVCPAQEDSVWKS